MGRILLAVFVLVCVLGHSMALKKDDCEGIYCIIIWSFFILWLLSGILFLPCLLLVCFAVIEKFDGTLSSQERKDSKVIEEKFRKFCKGTKGKENRFVSGGTDEF